MDPSKPSSGDHRDVTDDSLRRERDKSDDEVQRLNGRAAGVADEVVVEAREVADEVLRQARAAEPGYANPQQARARDVADVVLQKQRETADLKLDEARSERTRALASLFALEREVTDQHLQSERDRADLALTNRDDFLAMVAHDLRGYMGDIALGAAVLVRAPGGDENAGQRAVRIGQGIQRATAGMKRLVGDLLDVAAIEAGRLQVDVAPGDVASVIRDAAEPFRAAAQAKGLALDVEEIPASVSALFDHDRVIQVLGNLVGNAIKFSPSGGRIALRLSANAQHALVAVADTGGGIEPDKLEHIFERFTQLAGRDRLGLGLYISRCLVEAQRGRLWADSTPGKGSTFTFTLPLAPA